MKHATRLWASLWASSLLLLACSIPLALAAPMPPPAPGWITAGSAPADYDFGTDTTQAVQGTSSAYIKAKAATAGGFGTMMQTISADHYRGKRVQLSAMLKTQDARRAQMWMRVDGAPGGKPLAFDNMDERPLVGSADWTRCEIVLDVPAEAQAIAFGFFLSGTGKVWADSFALDVVTATQPATGAAITLPAEPVNPGFE
ncbi:MAG: transcriptional regulator [Hydrocarboniphaga sp.]|uniref:hypothetical protein n=1 Tax=Hydrocarboniphaga sp. TaxID=2033016 RepID=UPI00261690DD|nr:hypothetical protein [Hydrocarboniphaga sp.]MDB5972732.1 transcriptional regulator [Hydrocarboniphaga sp.]